MITKSDILDRKFNKTLRGFDPVEVKYFLEMLADEFEKLESKIAELEPIEKQLQDMKIKSPDDLIRDAENKAQKIIDDAEKLARDVIEQTKKKKDLEKEEITVLEHRRNRMIKLLGDAMDKQKDLVDILKNFRDDSEEIETSDDLIQ